MSNFFGAVCPTLLTTIAGKIDFFFAHIEQGRGVIEEEFSRTRTGKRRTKFSGKDIQLVVTTKGQ
jgi:hypothetical protein